MSDLHPILQQVVDAAAGKAPRRNSRTIECDVPDLAGLVLYLRKHHTVGREYHGYELDTDLGKVGVSRTSKAAGVSAFTAYFRPAKKNCENVFVFMDNEEICRMQDYYGVGR